MVDNTIYTLFNQSISHCYQCNLNLYQTNEFSSRNKGNKSNKIRLRSNTIESKIKNPITYLNNKYYKLSNFVNSFFYSGHLNKPLIKEG